MPTLWDREQLFSVVTAYADRYDVEVSSQLPNMIGLAEDRMSRIMRNREMSSQLAIPITGAKYYDLPSDFAGMRDINITGSNGPASTTLQYLNPEQANNAVLDKANRTYYTLIANQLQIVPLLEMAEGDTGNINIVYYQRVPNLLNASDTNWVLTNHADIYKTAMLAEIEIFVKNDQRATMFWQQLDTMFAEIETRDWQDRWSGTPLSVKLEHLNGT